MTLNFKFYDFASKFLFDVTLIDLDNNEIYGTFDENEGDVFEFDFKKEGVLLQATGQVYKSGKAVFIALSNRDKIKQININNIIVK